MTAATKDSQLSLRLPEGLKQDLAAYAEVTGRSKSHVVMEAMREYLDWRVAQVEDLRQAVAAADAGEFASDAEVRAVLDAYRRPAAKRAPGKRPIRRGR